jgi:hypothetical protein
MVLIKHLSTHALNAPQQEAIDQEAFAIALRKETEMTGDDTKRNTQEQKNDDPLIDSSSCLFLRK